MINRNSIEHKSLNILQVASHSSLRRGGAIQLSLLVQGLLKRNHNVSCIFNTPTGKEKIKGEEDLKFFNQNIGKAEFLPLKISMRAFRQFKQKIDSEKFDVIHVHRDEALNLVFLSGLLFHNIPIVAQRGTNYTLKRFGLTGFALRNKQVKKIIAVSEAVKKSLIRDGIKSEKIEVIYGGVDFKRFNPDMKKEFIRKELGIPENSFVFGNIASIAPKKGHNIFFKSASVVAKKFPQSCFLLAGDGNFRKFAPLLKDLGIENKVYYLGFRRDIENVIASIDVMVCSSIKGEGLTGAIREAFAMKKPVISTDVAGNSEFVIPNNTGYLVPPDDVDSLARIMIECAQNYQKSLSLAQKGFEMVCERSDNEKRCEKIEKIYLEIINQ